MHQSFSFPLKLGISEIDIWLQHCPSNSIDCPVDPIEIPIKIAQLKKKCMAQEILSTVKFTLYFTREETSNYLFYEYHSIFLNLILTAVSRKSAINILKLPITTKAIIGTPKLTIAGS
jgi:hypothetical protein